MNRNSERTDRKEARLVARTTTETQEIIQRAADYSGTTLSQFLIEAAQTKAYEVIERSETLRLSKTSADALLMALDNPPEPNTKLLKAAQSYKASVNVDQN